MVHADWLNTGLKKVVFPAQAIFLPACENIVK